jgi:hypothetical protein
MCTVTLVPHAAGVRVMCNRDERRTRASAAPPARHRLGSRDAIYPRDPEGGGTWIGVNDAGLVLALLNVHDRPRDLLSEPRSRGIIVRGLVTCETLAEAVSAAAAIDLRRFAPFRLVLLQDRVVAVATTAGGKMAVSTLGVDVPLLFTSSGLGDARVAGPRQQLFDRLVVRGQGGWLMGQARFHRHQWPQRPDLSVRMERGDALTVSRTTVDVGPRLRTVWYEAPVGAIESREGRQWCSLS